MTKVNEYRGNMDNVYWLQSTIYFQEILKIKKIFDKEKLNFVFLKGLPLHLYYEKFRPRRLYLDCDMLIAKDQFERTEETLCKIGYKKNDVSLSKGQKYLNNKAVEVIFCKPVSRVPVVFDLHTETVFMMTQLGKLNALYPQKLIDQFTADCLKSKRNVNVQGNKFLILDSEFLILYLALHFFHHNFRGTFRLEFLNKVIRKSKIDWSKELEIIKKYRLQNFIYPSFFLLKKYYHTPISNRFLENIQPANPLTRELVNRIIRNTNVFNDEPRVTAGINRFKNLFLLSPHPWWQRLLVFFNPSVIYSVFWTTKRRLFSFFSNPLPVR